ncbi:alpha/beta hydrolase [Frankia sp. Cas3]|uniref:alpha/beta hydrolase n=1 Tax=Frankia sp. Cas3 TaxID=3073926 RepID=UPI002AD22E1F|nr:alpha/beta hydrolase [Frankia sp. Cas3]
MTHIATARPAGPRPDDVATTGLDCLAETAAFNAAFEAKAKSRPDRARRPDAVMLAALRRNRLGGDTPPVRLAEAHDRDVEVDGARVKLRVLVPSVVEGVYLHMHGGGWMFGSADGQDEQLWDLARTARLAVLSVDYRLAPEHPFPAAPDDCERAALWLTSNAVTEFGTDRLLIGGESAGAHLSLTSLLRLRDRHAITNAFRAVHLTFGPFDLSMTPSQRLFGARPLLTNTDSLRTAYDAFLPDWSPEQRRDPELSPLYADLSGMPAARIVVGTADPLLDDSLFLAARWRAAGIPVELEVVAGAMHGFTLFPLTVTEQELRRQAEFLSQV